MNKKLSFRSFSCTLFLTLILQGGEAVADECLNDMKTRVKGKENCLAIHTIPSLSQVKPSTIVIFIHGDQSDGGTASQGRRFTSFTFVRGAQSRQALRPYDK